MPRLFREIPPIEIIEQLLQSCGIYSIQDTSWFSKQQIQLELFEEQLPILEPYYIPCKAQEYLYTSLTLTRAITILRQVLREHKYQLTSKEKTCGSEKIVLYQIQAQVLKNTPLDHEVNISFT